ncbi:MAG: DUF2071 domain-containing protein [Myxococcaceae bacterium]|nr:DUF2071 domain-containing protein [Myxococcaceae bacterium]
MRVDEIDRIAPTRRPTGARPVQRQDWRELLFLHWRVPAAVLQPLLPPELTVDTFEGDAYVGLVPFTMKGVRPVWAPALPGLSAFHETNVRTYVHLGGREPGVWFFSLDAASSVAVALARSLWFLPYHRARMALAREPDGTIGYVTERRWPGPLPATCRVRYRPVGEVRPAEPGTLEHFLVERYLLYARDRSGRLRVGRVHHRPYPLQGAVVLTLEESLLTAAGLRRGEEPPLAHYAEGVDVEVFGLTPAPVPPPGS